MGIRPRTSFVLKPAASLQQVRREAPSRPHPLQAVCVEAGPAEEVTHRQLNATSRIPGG